MAFAVALMLASLPAAGQQRAAGVLVDQVDMREIRDTQSVIGRLVATRQSAVAARIGGVINAVSFTIGDTIAKGQTLAVLDTQRAMLAKRVAQASVGVAEAEINIADAKLKLAKQAFERQESLLKSTAFSRSLDTTISSRPPVRRQRAGARAAQLSDARANLTTPGRLRIRSIR